MSSITSWTRLEPRTRCELDTGLQARVRDPLWLLGRQWQVGEFTGEDAGSPMQVRTRLEGARLTRYLPGTPGPASKGLLYDPGQLPLEALVEREEVRMDLRMACETGLLFLQLLEQHGAGEYRREYVGHYPLLRPADSALLSDETLRLLRVAGPRTVDGARLAGDLRAAAGGLPAAPTIKDADRERVQHAAQAWLAWLDTLIGIPPDHAPMAWDAARMEYSFAVAAPAAAGERVLVASEYTQGHLDWHAFDQRPDASLGAGADSSARQELVRTAIPAPVGYRGMPAARWWEFEDAQVNFGKVDASPSDLLRLLLIGFALDYGNDWFVLPVELPAGALYRVTSLVVTDSFGERTLVRPYSETAPTRASWRMFCLSSDVEGGADDNLLFLPPTLAAGLHGEPIEEVLLVRDEIANLAWAVERVVEDAGGRPVDRVERYRADSRVGERAGAASESAEISYRLATPVPDYWLPLVPVRADPAKPDIRLRRGRVLLQGATEPVVPAPRGRILEPAHPIDMFEEEVSRAGASVTRAYQYARWTDGAGCLWIGRRKRPGRGESASGLRFDSLFSTPSEPA